MKFVFVPILLVVVVAGGATFYVCRNNGGDAVAFRTVEIERGDLTTTISATGTLEPETLTDVGSQITGKILDFGPDPDHPGKTVDYCSQVKKGQLLANIDPTYYQAKVEQCKAALVKAEAELEQMKANCKQAKNEWDRARELRPMKAIADTDYDAAEAGFLVAQSNIAVGEASVQQAKAALDMAEVDLNYTVIRSPVDGVVIERRVNVGQTVTAGLNTPSMFLIAKDLRRMEVWIGVNEADIGHIRLEMPVQFTVGTHDDMIFRGKVSQIRMNASMAQNVVSYTVVVTAENPDLKLRPYMTANVEFEVECKRDVLMVSNAALQWKPDWSQIAPNALAEESAVEDDEQAIPTQGDAIEEAADTPPASTTKLRRIWTPDGDKVRPLDVFIGITDDINTEISGPGAQEGMKIVTGEARPENGEGEEDPNATTNPFLPKPPKRRRHRRPPPI